MITILLFTVDRVKDELQKVIDLLGKAAETDTEYRKRWMRRSADINDLQEEFDENDSGSKRWPVIASALPWPTFWVVQYPH